MPVFPSRTTRKLRYATTGVLTVSAVAVASTYVFSANGLFDPDITSTGHQPMGFDQLMLSYEHYHVQSARISINFKNRASVPINVLIRIAPDAVAVSDAEQLLEYGLLNTDTIEAKSVNGSVKRLYESVSIKRIQGVDDIMDVTDLSGTAAANPVEQTYFHVCAWDPFGDGGTVAFEAIIEYEATFTEPRKLTPSQIAGLQRLLQIADRTRPCPERKTPSNK